MKAASPALLALLNSGADFQKADLWTFRLVDGTVVRWSGADVPVYANGYNYTLGPVIERSNIARRIGVEVDELTAKLIAGPGDMIAGQPIIPFVRDRRLDGASVSLDFAYLTDWTLPVVGTLNGFRGRVAAVPSIAGSTAELHIVSWMVLLNVSMPAHLYQSACRNNVYDIKCGLSAAAFSASGIVSAAPKPDAGQFTCTALTTPDIYALGQVLFTSGANAGVRRAIRSNDTSGLFTLSGVLPALPRPGDAFTVTQGCDRTSTTCSGRFNNLAHFQGTEFIPTPETVL